MQYICTVCNYIYDEDKGIPNKGIAPGTKWEKLPADWKCPLCGAPKSAFKAVGEQKENEVIEYVPHVEKEMSAMEMSILCSNLARGCEKQYMFDQAEDFRKLADVFLGKAQKDEEVAVDKMLTILKEDLDVRYPYTNEVAKKNSDRGAQRVIVWGEKVTNMLYSILKKYKEEGDSMFEDGDKIWLCSVCGFIYIGKDAPELCPVCKVPAWKFDEIERRI